MEPKEAQKRTVNVSKVQFRAASGDKPATVSGYASVFNKLSESLGCYGGGRELIAPGAFTDVLATNPDCRLLINHDSNLILARTVSGTLKLNQDDTGLHFEAALGNQSYAKDLAESMSRGDITGCSFAFCIDDCEQKVIDGEPIQVIRSVSDLSDVSCVTYPAYPDATATVRAMRFELPDPVKEEFDAAVWQEWLTNNLIRQIQLMEIE